MIRFGWSTRRGRRVAVAGISLLLASSCASVRYPNWGAVRIEPRLPSPTCEYRAQEACPAIANEGCYNWYKKRATTYDANVVILRQDLPGIAEYFACPGYVPEIDTGEPEATDEGELL